MHLSNIKDKARAPIAVLVVYDDHKSFLRKSGHSAGWAVRRFDSGLASQVPDEAKCFHALEMYIFLKWKRNGALPRAPCILRY